MSVEAGNVIDMEAEGNGEGNGGRENEKVPAWAINHGKLVQKLMGMATSLQNDMKDDKTELAQ
eukprot:9483099-Pyramimonas_sp.AAC.1